MLACQEIARWITLQNHMAPSAKAALAAAGVERIAGSGKDLGKRPLEAVRFDVSPPARRFDFDFRETAHKMSG